MQAPSWPSWQLRYLPTVKSIVYTLPRTETTTSHLHKFTSHQYLAVRCMGTKCTGASDAQFHVGKEIRDRVEQLQKAGIDCYPRAAILDPKSSIAKFNRRYKRLERGEVKDDKRVVSYQGRVESVRTAGSSLFFVDIFRKDRELQVLVNRENMVDSSMSKEEFVAKRKLLRRGDIISASGHAYRTLSGQLSLRTTEVPRILSPCLHQYPLQKPHGEHQLENESHYLDKHVEMLANKESAQLLIRRSQIIHEMRQFLAVRSFVEVQTPVLASTAGGAIARCFQTAATEFSNKPLSLRVAPELWLKRLILGGMDRIFEIGPCFRNEGLDKLHNPEFTTCEFYSAYTTIKELVKTTETMLCTIVQNIESVPTDTEESIGLRRLKMLPLALEADYFKGPYRQIDFLPALNMALSCRIPDLSTASATEDLLKIFDDKEIPIPARPNLPRLLDKLSSIYLEPLCDNPTWIINQPECLSPLSKSFVHPSPDVAQSVAARAELFVGGQEIVNCYEEENSPFEQRRKFTMQQEYAVTSDGKPPDPEAMQIDDDYLKALEWGLPPTGGWGCGIDRLVMVLTGRRRINDVLAFGNLRSATRVAVPREMVMIAESPLILSKSDPARGGGSKVRAATSKSTSSNETTVEEESSNDSNAVDTPEEAVIKIRAKLNRTNIGRTKRRSAGRGGASSDQKRLAIWLAGRGDPDAAERLLNR